MEKLAEASASGPSASESYQDRRIEYAPDKVHRRSCTFIRDTLDLTV